MSTKKIVLWGCGSLFLIGVIAVVGIGMFLSHVGKDLEGAAVRVVGPDEVSVGDTFDLEVFVHNTRKNKTLKVDDIDIADVYLEGFVVTSTEPNYKSTNHVPIDDSQSFTFNQAIAVGKTNRFVFKLRAVKAGTFKGDLDVMEGLVFVTQLAQTVVKEKEEKK